MIKWTSLGIFFILPFFKNGFCQVSGKVSDSRTGKPLDGVEVFIDRGTDFSNTTEEGQFELRAIDTGFVTLVLYKNGYELYHSSMRVQDGRAYTLNLTLTPEKKRESGSVRQTFQDDIQTGYRIVSYENPQLSKRKFMRFELLASTDLQQQVDWERIRNQLYRGSLRHFLASLVHGTCTSEGFEIRRDGKEVSPESLITTTSLEDYYRLVLGDPVEVIYNNQSSILVARGALDVSNTGLLLNEDLLEVTGTMKNFRLPISYVPFAGDVDLAFEEMIKRYYEKVYVHTDKPYYYQGEPMWFKVYMNYYDLSMRDSLSRVLYVELISPEQEIVLEKMLKIDSGMAQGDFILPDTIKRGDYFLRAYTNLQRNFGDENLYVKHIPVLGITDKVDPTQAEWTPVKSDRVTIRTDKERYNTRDKIEMTIEVRDEEGNPIDANLSVSVTDASQVVPMSTSNITEEVRKDGIAIPNALNHPLEHGVAIEGTYYDKDGKTSQTMLNLVQWRSDNMALVETDADGKFIMSGFDFYDSARIFYSVPSSKSEKGKILLEKKESAKWNPDGKIARSIGLITTESQQRIFSEYEVPKDVRMLEALEVRSNRVETIDRSKRSYGIAKNVDIIRRENMKTAYGDLNYSLIGAVPGLLVQRTEGGWNIRILRATGLSTQASEPLVTIDDVPMFGRTAGEVIGMIDPNAVESIEVKKSIGVLYGAQGVNGVIAVYTRPINEKKDGSDITKTAASFTAKGYDKPREFAFPDYSKSKKSDHADYRSGVYWNPDLKTDVSTGNSSFTFYSADFETTYKVVVEGITSKNVPIYAEHFITISND